MQKPARTGAPNIFKTTLTQQKRLEVTPTVRELCQVDNFEQARGSTVFHLLEMTFSHRVRRCHCGAGAHCTRNKCAALTRMLALAFCRTPPKKAMRHGNAG